MGITFTRAPLVEKGDPIVSTQYAKLADAFNSRLRSGLGDGPWRIVYYWLSLFRQVRNSDTDGNLFPAMAEFFTAGYQMLEPEDGQWPVAGPGEAEGANVACQIMNYVFGSEAANMYDEAHRVTDTAAGGIPLVPAGTPNEIWELGKLQRGGIDPDTGKLGSPAWKAARSFYGGFTDAVPEETPEEYPNPDDMPDADEESRKIRAALKFAVLGSFRSATANPRSPHGNAYGGYLPTAKVSLDWCEEVGGTRPINYEIFFSPLKTGLEPITFAGTCRPTGGNAYANHVRYIGYTPWAYYVFLNSGEVIPIDTSDYMEGPYEGEAQLRKTANNAVARMLNSFAGEYRGSDTQRALPGYWLDEAFDTQLFLASQYHLAANIAVPDEEDPDLLDAIYPTFELTDPTPVTIDGEPRWQLTARNARHVQSNTTQHAYHADFVLSACLITASGLVGKATIELKNGSTVMRSVEIEADESGNVAQIVTIPGICPTPLTIRLATTAIFTTSSGRIDCECNEILKQKPNMEDLFLVLRAGGALSGSDATDGRGIDEDEAKTIGDNYFANACITNAHGNSELPFPNNEVNNNGLFDAARRLSQCVRIIPRQNFVGYAVENGKSVLWFKQNALIGTKRVALFSGIIKPGGYKVIFDLNKVGEVAGITTEDGMLITTQDGTIIRTQDQPSPDNSSHRAYSGTHANPTSLSPSQLLAL